MERELEAAVEGAMSALHRAVAIHQFYPGTHYLSREAMETGYGAFVQAVVALPPRGALIALGENALRLDGLDLGAGNPAVGYLTHLLRSQGVLSLKLEGVVPPEGYAHLVALLATAPELLARRGGFAAAWNHSPYASGLRILEGEAGRPQPARRRSEAARERDWSAPLHPESGAEVLAHPKFLSRLKAFQQRGPLELEMLDLLFRAGEPGDARTLTLILERIADIVVEYVSTQQYRSAYQTVVFLYREAENQAALGRRERADRLLAAVKTMLRGQFLHWLTYEVASTRESEDAEIGECLLSFLGEVAVVFVINALAAERTRQGRRRLVSVLVSIGAPALPAALRMLGDQRWFVVRNMLAVVGGIGDPSTVERLAAFLGEPDPRVRREAVRALGRFRLPQAEESLRKFLRDADAGVRNQAVAALAAQGTATAYESLRREFDAASLGGEDWDLKLAIAEGMGRLGRPEAVSFLGEILSKAVWLRRDRWARIQLAAILSLGELGGPEALALLAPLKSHPNPDLRRAAERSIAAAEHARAA